MLRVEVGADDVEDISSRVEPMMEQKVWKVSRLNNLWRWVSKQHSNSYYTPCIGIYAYTRKLKDNMLSDKTMTCDPYFLSFQVQESIDKVTKPYYSGCQSTYTISALLEWERSSTQPMYFCLMRQKWIHSISARLSDFSFLIVCLPIRMNDCLCCW